MLQTTQIKMHIKNIAILTSKESWITPYAKKFVNLFRKGFMNRD